MTLDVNFNKSAYKNNTQAALQIFLQIILIYLTAQCFFRGVTLSNFIWYFFAIIFIGTRMRALGNIMHECAHGTFVPSKKGNIFFGTLISILDLSSFQQYRRSHILHHKFLGNEEKDEDYKKYLILIRPYRDKKIFNNFFILFVLVVFNPLNWIFYVFSDVRMDPAVKPRDDRRDAVGSLRGDRRDAVASVVLKLFVILLFLKYTAFLLIPYLTTYQIMKISSDFLDHHKVYFDKDNALKTRNHAFKSKLLNLFFFPRNDSYHLVHHMYPRAPVTDLARIHKFLLATNTKYRGRRHHLI